MLTASLSATTPAHGAPPFIALSITGSTAQTICDTDNGSHCITVNQADLLLCQPISFGMSGEVTGCHWRILFDGVGPGPADPNAIDQQMRALSVAADGSLVFVVGDNDTVPGGLLLKSNDITVFTPNQPLKPFVGGGPYVTADGAFKKYLDGVLTQADPAAKPWDALDLINQNGCEKDINANSDNPRTCPIIGSLSGGSGAAPNFGRQFNNEDMIRCIPTGWAGNGAVEACQYAVMLDASAITINGVPNGITSDIEAIDIRSFDPDTMQAEMVFMKKSGNPPDFPPNEPGRDLLVYTGRLGSGLCVPSNKPCAGDDDCPSGETCDTGSCFIGGASCETDQDCSGSGNFCVYKDPNAYAAQITLYFDGSAVGLTGLGQRLEAFAIIPDTDGDGLPDGLDNCPTVANAPSICDGPGPETCSGLDSQCPSGEHCVQVDTDGDGVGDACDQCNGRPDPGTCDTCPSAPCPGICAGADSDCSCGDGIADFPSEKCDLGAENGQPDSPCSATCTIFGKCKGSGTPCDDITDCPAGEGCCGNGIREGSDIGRNEDCDDGNVIDDDSCHNDCTDNLTGLPVLGCEDLTGPNVLPAALKVTKFKDTAEAPDLDRWKTKGEAIFAPGLTLDPDSENVTMIYNRATLLFSSTLAPANCTPAPTCFVQKDPKLKWKFKDKEADVPGSPGWRKGKFTIKGNKIKFNTDGRKTTVLAAADAAAGVRQTVRVGDVCLTTVMTCTQKGTSFKCLVPTLP